MNTDDIKSLRAVRRARQLATKDQRLNPVGVAIVVPAKRHNPPAWNKRRWTEED